jgi:hypothetical protein
MHVAHGKLPTESSVCVEIISTYLGLRSGWVLVVSYVSFCFIWRTFLDVFIHIPSILTCSFVGVSVATVVVPNELGQQRLLTAVVEKTVSLPRRIFLLGICGRIEVLRRRGGLLRGQTLLTHDGAASDRDGMIGGCRCRKH